MDKKLRELEREYARGEIIHSILFDTRMRAGLCPRCLEQSCECNIMLGYVNRVDGNNDVFSTEWSNAWPSGGIFA